MEEESSFVDLLSARTPTLCFLYPNASVPNSVPPHAYSLPNLNERI